MATEPSQDQVTHHFMEMAKGMVTDADIQSINSRRGLGGHSRGRSVNYRMMYPNTLAKPPVQNVTSDVAQSIDQAKSRLGRAIKLDTNLDNEPVAHTSQKRRHHHHTSSSSSRKKSSHKKRRKHSDDCPPAATHGRKKGSKRGSSGGGKRRKQKHGKRRK